MFVGLLVSNSGDFDRTALCTWQAALDLWQLGWTTYDLAEVATLRPEAVPLLVADGFGPCSEMPWATLSAYVRRGGHLILTGIPGGKNPEALVLFQELTRVRSVLPGSEESGFPALMVTGGSLALAPWRPGEVLFFTNPAFSVQSRNAWGKIVELAKPGPQVLARTYWTTILPAPNPEQFAGHASTDPGLVACQPFPGGGQVLYTPIPLGSIRHVLTPQAVEVDSYPCKVVNHGMFLLLKSLVCYLLSNSQIPIPLLDLWPAGTASVICLTGDVHEFNGSPSGRAREEFRYISRMADLVASQGLSGKFTFFVTGLLAKKHPEVLRNAMACDFGGHTYSDTMYIDVVPPASSVGAGNPEAPDLTVGRAAQQLDVSQTLSALACAAPDRPSWRRNWRTHYYASTATTREILAEQGVKFLSDMSLYWPGEWQTDRFGWSLVTYVSYPQRAQGTKGQPLDVWEMGEVTPSDYALWVSGERHPDHPWARVLDGEAAFQVWARRIERAWRCQELFVVNWHPFHSLQKPERIEVLRKVISFAKRLPGISFMTLSEAGEWWAARSRIRMTTLSLTLDSLTIALENQGKEPLAGITLQLLLPCDVSIERFEAAPTMTACQVPLVGRSLTNSVGLQLALPAQSHTELTIWFGSRQVVGRQPESI